MDVAAYSEALDRFLIEMEKISEPYAWELQSILEGVCETLRIGKIELFSYETLSKEQAEDGEMLTYYLKDLPETDADYAGRHVSGRGTVITIKFFRKNNDAAWSQEELNRIKALDSVLYTYNAKIRLTKFAESSLFYDRELHIPNMAFFFKEVGILISSHRFQDYAVCFFNLKRFVVINQLLGRENGTKVMAKFIVGLQKQLRQKGTVCRTGGDNFIAFFEKSEADTVAEYLSGTEIVYGSNSEESVVVKASAGIYQNNGEWTSVDEVMEKAHLAMQSARNLINHHVVFYTDELRHMQERAAMIEVIFREAIYREEFQLFYQPKVQLNDYSVAGAQAMCRWRHEGNEIKPEEFIPVLEQSNSICVLDFYVLERVCKDIRGWLDQKLSVVRVSVTLSKQHLGDERLLDKILEIVDQYEVPHQYIEIVFTETTSDVAFRDLKTIVNGLHSNGIHTSLEDFGVGYSSLNLIRQVAWDAVKIDKSFLPDVTDRTSSRYLMFSHLLSMLRELGLKCSVEGVETLEQVKMLKENKCFLAQGSYFDGPLGAEEFQKRIVVE